MANKFQTKRTTISGRTPNTTNSGNTHYIDAGELALNLTDGKMFSSNGSVYFEVGANVQNLSVTGNATIKAIIANGSIGSNGNILASNGSAIYWATSGNAVFSRSVTTYTANGTANSFVVTGGYIEEQLDVYVNGVRYNSADYYANDTVNVGLIDTPGSGDTVELISYIGGSSGSGTVTQVNTGIGLSGGPITNTGTIQVIANNGIIANSTGIFANAGTGIVANATGIHVNSSYIATISANNTSFLDGVAAASYVQNTDSRTLSGNLVISGTSFTPSSNTVLLGNTTQRWVLSANTGSFSGAVSGITTLAAGNTTITGFANVSSTIQGGSSLIIAGALSGVTTADMGNTTITGFANVTSTIQGGSSLTIAGAASGITTLAAGNTTITGFANASVSVNSALLTVGTSFIANTTGVYHTGLVNAASINIGSSGFIANSTAIVLGEPVTANGTTGTAGQVLASNGTVGTPYWITVAAGGTVTVTDDTATNGTRYIAFANQTSGNLSSVFVDSTGLTFNPSTGTVTAAIFSATSDERLKSDIQAVVNPIEKIKSINGVNFTYKASNTRSMGVIAQEVEKQMPELVNMNSEGYRQVNYNGIIGVLVEAVKQQQQQITYLNNQIDILRSDK